MIEKPPKYQEKVEIEATYFDIQIKLQQLRQAPYLPPLWNRPQRRLHQPAALMAGEAEVNEPLAVEPAGHFLQDLDAPLAVLDQIVVGGEDAGDAALDGECGDINLKIGERRLVNDWGCGPSSHQS